MAVDLHLHSTASDGTDPPAQIVRLASERGLRGIALTDHDNLDGIAQAREAAAVLDLAFISGVELSVDWDGRPTHLLVYHLEPGSGPLQDRLSWLQTSRADRNLRIAGRLRDLGIPIDFEEVVAEAGGSGVGRPHFAAVLTRMGVVDSVNEAFERYLAAGRPGYVPRNRLEMFEAIDLARASGAVPVVAHPHTVGLESTAWRTALEELADAGLGGLEAYYPEYPPDMRAHLAALADTVGIIPTGGSDYHGTYKPELQLGVGRGDLVVPDDVIDRLDEARHRGETGQGVPRPHR